MVRYRSYQQSGHPDVASQYSQGWFSLEIPGTAESFIAEVIESLHAARRRAESQGYTTHLEYDAAQGYAELTILQVCDAEDHEGEGCECYEDMEAFDVDMSEGSEA